MNAIDTKQLAERWGFKVKPGTIENWRQFKKGPKWIKLGKHKGAPVIYKMKDVIAYEKKMEYSGK